MEPVNSLAKTYSLHIFDKVNHLRGSTFILRNLRRFSDVGAITGQYRGFQISANPLDTVGRKVLSGTVYEPRVLEILNEANEDGDTVVEVGGHIGVHTLTIRENITSQGELYVFEADPENYSLLNHNLSQNNFSDVYSYNKAVFDDREEIKIFRNEGNTGASSVKRDLEDHYSVSCIRLSEFLNENSLEHVDLLKLDVEGAEYEIIRDVECCLDRIDQIVVELHSRDLSREQIKEIKEILSNQGDLKQIESEYNPLYLWTRGDVR
jgi:FkbM family methyltransferase